MNNTSSINIVETNVNCDENIKMLEKDIKDKLFCEKYKGDELTQKVAGILKLDSNSGWSVVDTFENLAMVHYNEDANMN